MSLFPGKNDPLHNAEKAEGAMKKNSNGSLAPNKPAGDTPVRARVFQNPSQTLKACLISIRF